MSKIAPIVVVFKIEGNVWALRQMSPAKIIDDNWAYLIGGKEVLSLVSHCHLDHANGSHQWAEIYCHQFCADNLVKKQKEGQDHALINLDADYDLELIHVGGHIPGCKHY